MPWPPDPLPNNRSNITPQLDNHPSDHNDIANTLAEDFVPQVSGNLAAIGVNTGNIGVNAANIISGDAATLAAALAEQILVQSLTGTSLTTTTTFQTTNTIVVNPTRSAGVLMLIAAIDVFIAVAGSPVEDTFVARMLTLDGASAEPDEIIWRPRGIQDERLVLTKTWAFPIVNNVSRSYSIQVRQVGAPAGSFSVGGVHTTLRGVFVG